MKTAVQLRSGPPLQCELLLGQACAVTSGTLGPVALFDDDRIVAYRITSRRRSRLFVFRTLAVDDRMAASVPGVYPRVCLLLETHAAAAIEQVRRLFAFIEKRGYEPARLPDVFYRRVSLAVGRRRPTQTPLRNLLRKETSEEASLRPASIRRKAP